MTELIAEGAGADLPPAPAIDGLTLAVAEPALILMVSGESGNEAFANAVKDALGLALPKPGEIAGTDPALLWHGLGRWLVIAESAGQDLSDKLGKQVPISDVTDGYLVVEISGAKLRALLQMGTSLDLSEEAPKGGRSAVTRFAEVPALLLLLEPDRARLLVERASRAYVWAWLGRAAAALR